MKDADILSRHKQNWEDLAEVDPLWAILSNQEKKFRRWDVDEFFGRGEKEIGAVMRAVEQLGGLKRREESLDFGCGVGRLTRALAGHFKKSHGVDISENMIRQAKELNKEYPACEFLLNTADNLAIYPSEKFDFIYTTIVLHHIPQRSVIFSYIQEFMRVLRPEGILVFQLPSHLPLKNRLQLRRRLYAGLRFLGFSGQFLYDRLHLSPITMNFVPENEIRTLLKSLGAQVLEIQASVPPGTSVENRVYYVARAVRE